MLADDPSLSRRVKELETQVAELRRELSGTRQLPPAAVAPRERWLGRTTSDSPSTYPTSGDTFEVELYSAYFTATPGTRAITETGRGRKVVARTRPATYLPRGTEVEVWRSRGHGPLGAGEWWIGLPAASARHRLIYGGNNGYGLDIGGVLRNRYGNSSLLYLFPGAIEVPTPAVGSENQYLAPPAVVALGQPSLMARRAATYLVNMSATIMPPKLTMADHRRLYDPATTGHLSQLAAPPGPPWTTGPASAGTAHTHEYWPHVSSGCWWVTSMQFYTTAQLAPLVQIIDESPAVHSYDQQIHTISRHSVLTLAEGEELRLQITGAFRLAGWPGGPPSGFAPYDAYLLDYVVSFLWIA